ncbi:MAG TPA: SRPBCC family protein [Propionibacteriaceae bacterium]|jgi:uncharacterized protein YndB with AHSA1/START domain
MIFSPVSVTRHMTAPPSAVFDILVDPAKHLQIDGSGMLQATISAPTPLRLHSRFSVDMRQAHLPYRVENIVTEYQQDQVIAWRPWVHVCGRRVAGGVTWRYQLTPLADGTQVTETYDVTTAWGARLLAALGYPAKMRVAMIRTLDNLARQTAKKCVRPAPPASASGIARNRSKGFKSGRGHD